jgi:hypothetical protein
MPDEAPVPKLEVLRDSILRELDERRAVGAISTPAEIASLAAAAVDLDRMIAAQATRAPAPTFDVEALAGQLWNRMQEQGHPTQVSDDAVECLRAALLPPTAGGVGS